MRAVLYKTYRELDRRVEVAAGRDEICLRFMYRCNIVTNSNPCH